MGRAARNHGGTGGHGCPPLPGERPNYNRHVMNDMTLQGLITIDRKKLEVSREHQTQLEQQKASAAQFPVTALGESQPKSAKEKYSSSENKKKSSAQLICFKDEPTLETKTERLKRHYSVTSLNQLVTSDKKPLPSVKQPMRSAKLPVTPDEQLVSVQVNSKESTVQQQQPMPSAKLPVTTDEQTPTVKVSSKESTVQQEQQALALNMDTSAQKPLIKVQLPVIKVQLPVTKLQHPVDSAQYPVTLNEQPVTFAKKPVASVPNLVTSQEQQQQTLTSDQPLSVSAQKEMIKDQLSLTKCKHPVTSVKLLGTSDKMNEISDDHKVISTVQDQQKQTLVHQPVYLVKQLVSPNKHPDELTVTNASDKQLPSIKQQETSAQQSSSTVTSEPITSVQVTKEQVTSEPVSSKSLTSGTVTPEPVTSELASSKPVTTEQVTSEPPPVITCFLVPTYQFHHSYPIHNHYFWVPVTFPGVVSDSSLLTNQQVVKY